MNSILIYIFCLNLNNELAIHYSFLISYRLNNVVIIPNLVVIIPKDLLMYISGI